MGKYYIYDRNLFIFAATARARAPTNKTVKGGSVSSYECARVLIRAIYHRAREMRMNIGILMLHSAHMDQFGEEFTLI